MRENIRLLGILNIIMGCLTALFGLAALFTMGTIAAFVTASLRSASSGGSDYGDAAVAAPVIAVVGLCIAIFFFVLSLPAIIGGWGLLHYRPWSRVLMIIVSALHLFHIPLGTALGIFGLYVLLSDEGRRVLESGGALRPGAYMPAGYPNGATYRNPPAPPTTAG